MRYVVLIFILCSCASKTIEVGQIKTKKGDILIYLHKETPTHKKSFIELAKSGYWDNYTFNRVIPNFVVQGGCPDTPESFTDDEYLLNPEFNSNLKHIYGAVGAGRDNNPNKKSARCQFYIVQNKEGLHRLDGDYTVFGHVIKGMDIVEEFVAVKTDSIDKPLLPIKLNVGIYKIKIDDLIKLYPSYKK